MNAQPLRELARKKMRIAKPQKAALRGGGKVGGDFGADVKEILNFVGGDGDRGLFRQADHRPCAAIREPPGANRDRRR
jgi:hypothetical protein